MKKYESPGKDKALVNRTPYLGTLVEAQYVNVYKLGRHVNDRALVTIGPQKAYRDKALDDKIITYSIQSKGDLAMYIHRGFPGAVNNWSEGCTVFKDKNSLDKFFSMLDKHISSGNKPTFTYTLMLAKNVGL